MLVTPVINYAVHLAASSIGLIASGAWWLTKRAIWGREITPEERMMQGQKELMDAMRAQTETVHVLTEEQHALMTAMEEQSRTLHEQNHIIESLQQQLATVK